MSTDASASARPPRKRAKHTRSKLGCGVCRIRRVRCDRTRPACERCTKTGRRCDGYVFRESNDTAPLAQRETPTPSSPSAAAGAIVLSHGPRDPFISAQGGRALDYFRNKTALELGGFFESYLWSSLILQISRREACVRQMVVALSSLHESFHMTHTKSSYPSSTLTLRQKAIGEYGLGINLLNRHIATQGWASLEVTLLCSILCVTFEWLRGDYYAAHTHLRGSMLVMSQWADGKRPLLNGTSTSSPGGYLIRTQLGPLWMSLVLQARTMPASALPSHVPLLEEESSEPFKTLQEARKALDILLAYVVPESISRKCPDPPPASKPWDLERRMAGWAQKFQDFLSTQNVEERESPRVTIMKLWHRTAHMIFIGSFYDDESQFDVFSDEFTHIVTKAEELFSSAISQFSVDIGIVPLLYYVALKCRHPLVRRRAVAIMTAAPRREAVWDSLGASCVAGEVIRVEEEGLGQVYTQSDIPSTARVCELGVVTDVENQRIWIRTLKQGSCSWSEEKILSW